MDAKTISVTVKLPLEEIDTDTCNAVQVEDFVGEYSRYVDWTKLSNDYAQNVSLDFIREYQHRFNWAILLNLRVFPEFFLKENYINFDIDCWEIISAKQNLSESFIHKFASKIDWELIKTHQNVSKKFLDDHKMYFEEEEINVSSGARRRF